MCVFYEVIEVFLRRQHRREPGPRTVLTYRFRLDDRLFFPSLQIVH